MSKLLMVAAIGFASVFSLPNVFADDHSAFNAKHEAMAKKHEAVTAGHEQLHAVLAKLMELMKTVK